MTPFEIEHVESVRLENVNFAYEDAKPTFESLTLNLPVNQNILIAGATPGLGTSTLLKLLAVVHQPQGGRVLINGQDTARNSRENSVCLLNSKEDEENARAGKETDNSCRIPGKHYSTKGYCHDTGDKCASEKSTAYVVELTSTIKEADARARILV